MTIGNILTLTPDLVQIMADGIDDMINNFGKQCLLVFPGRGMVQCANCWTKGTVITTNKGPQLIEDIRPNDYVITPSANQRKVVDILHRIYHGDLYNICCYGITTDNYMTAEHKLLVVKNMRKLYTQKQWFDNQFVLKNYCIEEVQAKHIKLGDGLFLPIINNHNPDLLNFDGLLLTDELLEFFGWWIAEGCLPKAKYMRVASLCLRASKEEHIADKIIDIISRYFGVIGKKEWRNQEDNLIVHFYSTVLVNFLKQFGVGAEHKIIPNELYCKLSLRQQMVLLRAYQAGDGNVFTNLKTSTYGRNSIVTVSRLLASQIFTILHNNELSPSMQVSKEKIDQNGTYHKQSWVVSWLDNRKQQKSGVRKVNGGLLSIIRKIIVKHDTVPVYNLHIAVEHEYIANNIASKNCVFDSIARRSRNIYRTGGPIPFGQGNLCPVCGGKGLISSPEITKPIKMIMRWNPGDFTLLPGNIEVPFSLVETEGWMSDLPDVLQSRVMIAELPVEGRLKARFELSGEPTDVNSISQGQTWTAHWKRRG